MGCGICGFVGLSDKGLLRSMCEAIRHRGPDDTDFFLDENVGLGIDRLKIIDLVSGDQPIHNEDETIWVVFNGEIYNYIEMKTALEARGHRFYTQSDTECIVHAYEEWGDDCVNHFRGMFAFALWDSVRKRLYMARDRFGKKPLYYAIANGVFLFGSELKTILQYEEVPRNLDRDAIDFYFTFMYIPSPLSIFKEIRKLPPATYGVFEGGRLAVNRYWDYSLNPDSSLTEDALVDMLFESMRDAVRVRMRSDVPLGAFLSGGIDSSTVVALMSRLSDQPVKTVSIGFENETSELGFARTVADFLKTDHHEFTVTPDAFELLPNLVWHFDEPFADHSMIPTYYLSRVTRGEATVALSGDGGDELFMGYPYLLDPPSYSIYSKIPSFIRRPVLRFVTALPGDRQFKRMANHAYEKDYGAQPFDERYVMRVSMYDAGGLEKLYSRKGGTTHDSGGPYAYMLDLIRNCKSKDPIDAVDYATIRAYLEEDILVKVDRMSMAVSLEVRCPLLDQELADLVARVPSRLKMNGRETKYIFKKMAVKKGLIPSEIALRKKQGFGAPIESWMQKEWKERVPQILDPVVTSGYTGLFDGGAVKSLLDDPYLNSSKLFALVTFVLWYKMYVEEARVNAPPSPVRAVA